MSRICCRRLKRPPFKSRPCVVGSCLRSREVRFSFRNSCAMLETCFRAASSSQCWRIVALQTEMLKPCAIANREDETKRTPAQNSQPRCTHERNQLANCALAKRDCAGTTSGSILYGLRIPFGSSSCLIPFIILVWESKDKQNASSNLSISDVLEKCANCGLLCPRPCSALTLPRCCAAFEPHVSR